ncbi:hypothetical protein [Microcoleus sp. FACHB-SPT15]|uniref:hypothetical protein n=1 Tax=Microcoleus sp. FACHB-SPT15 TaxID=2692830 RepID=UPI001F55A474|nr:hypothetical protein [Microcoleus sp. FACHB-SPT15]
MPEAPYLLTPVLRKPGQHPLNAFRELLKQRHIPLYVYDVEDFELDLNNLRELGRL